MKKIPLIIIAGPTASGKTALAVRLAKRLSGEIVSADSMQIYKYMNIGTAKPCEEEKEGIPHHMMDFLEPSVNFSVSDYCDMAKKIIEDIYNRGKLPILAGGTGLYIDSLAEGVEFGKMPENPQVRSELEKLAETEGNEAVYKILMSVDPETAKKYHPNNLRRVIRAIEFYRTANQTISEHAKEKKQSPYDSVYFCIDWDREVLYDHINRRVDLMLEEGLIGETKELLKMGISPDSTAMQSIGYKELFGYLKGEKTLEDAAEEIRRNTRRYAKRQLTWFRRRKDIIWLTPDEHMEDTAVEIIKKKFPQKD